MQAQVHDESENLHGTFSTYRVADLARCVPLTVEVLQEIWSIKQKKSDKCNVQTSILNLTSTQNETEGNMTIIVSFSFSAIDLTNDLILVVLSEYKI